MKSRSATPCSEPAGESLDFPIVGVGASAGGLEAFSELLAHLPKDTGMGFVLVQHLSPDHKSALTELLTKVSHIPVQEVTQDVRVEPNRVYVISPDHNLSLSQGVLQLVRRPSAPASHLSIDSFFESLAADRHERAIGVVLSGTATDGTLGLEAIKAAGGITFAQDGSAKYDSMPRSAIVAGCVDAVLSPARIAEELARMAKHPYLKGAVADAAAASSSDPATGADPVRPAADDRATPGGRDADGYKKVLSLLYRHAGVDFTAYKPNTIQRRIRRRMILSKLVSIDDYAALLRHNAPELTLLHADVLIHVTSFFRNPEAFGLLQQRIFPSLLQRPSAEKIRVWVAGCSAGQEAYSMAIALAEAADSVPEAPAFQVFATDLDAAVLETARAGFYPPTALADVSPERLQRFFSEEQGGYRINKSLRDQVVFAQHDLLRDPPFSRMDLISCRNLLIYLEPGSQQRIIAGFHYALKKPGFLFLGASESASSWPELFKPESKKQKVFSRKAGPSPSLHLNARTSETDTSAPLALRPSLAAPGGHSDLDLQRESDRVTLNRYAPCSVLVTEDLQILRFRGDTSPWLKPAAGKASFSLLKMARSGLLAPLRAALEAAKHERRNVRRENVRIDQDGASRTTDLEVLPLTNFKERYYLVFFGGTADATGRALGAAAVRAGEPRGTEAGEAVDEGVARLHQRVADLERELAESNDYLQSFQERSEAASQELQVANEEVTSANEELQSLNEELETSKEEIESTNEELTTVNEELAGRNTALNRLNSDLINLQTAVHLAVVLLARDLSIRRFSAKAGAQFNLLPSDIGRPFDHIRHDLDLPDLAKIIAGVTDQAREHEEEVQSKTGRWFLLRVRPYLTTDRQIDGAVLVLTDIDALKRIQRKMQDARDHAEILSEAAAQLLTVDAPRAYLEAVFGRLSRALGAEYFFNYLLSSDGSRLILETTGGLDDAQRAAFAALPAEALTSPTPEGRAEPDDARLAQLCVTQEAQALRLLQARAFASHPLRVGGRVLGLFSIASRSRAAFDEEELRFLRTLCDLVATSLERARLIRDVVEARDASERANVAKDTFLATLSHELRTPLSPVLLLAGEAAGDPDIPADTRDIFATIVKNVRLEARLIDDLLDVTRITHGKLTLDRHAVDVHGAIRDAIATVRSELDLQQHDLQLRFDAEPSVILGDPVRLQQIFWNVLRNATKFSPAGSEIRIETDNLPGGRMGIKITDAGIGMTDPELRRLFGSFAQGDHAGVAGSPRFGGLGLGLSISRLLVDLHAGTIRAESAGRNLGSTFFIEFPLHQARADESPHPSEIPARELAPPAADGRRPLRRILLVEDHEPTRRALAHLLQRRRYEVVAAESLATARSAADGASFDLLISDIGLPDGSGHELMSELRARCGIVGIAVTGYGHATDLVRSREAGFVTHLTKPVTIQALEQAMALAASTFAG